MSDAGITGSAAYLAFAGTTYHGNFRTINVEGNIGTVDQSAGADAGITRLTTLKDGSFSIELKRPAGGPGTAAWASALVEGTEGTLEVGPEGTATGKPKMTVNCILTRRSHPIVYNDVVIDTFEFEQDDPSGATWGVYS